MTPVSKLVVGSTFGIYPPRGGGQLRIFHLYRQLARKCRVDVVSLVESDQQTSRRQLAPGLTEIRIPKSEAHTYAEAEFRGLTRVPVTDVAFSQLHHLTPAFSEAVAACLEADCVLVASHPYAFPAMRVVDDGADWWYDAHNVEVDLKGAMLPNGRIAKRLLAKIRAVERECCGHARMVLASCAEDAERLQALYRLPAGRLMVIPNGVEVSSIRFKPPTERRALTARLRMTQPLALFIGSWHEPNLLAARQIVDLARQVPDVRFAIAGSVGIPLAQTERPANIELFGVVSDELKEALLSVAAVALNPMLHGSGTNMKMLDYMAAGIPVISTAVGARGLGLALGTDLRIATPDRFGEALRATLDEPGELADERARATRRKIEERFDWQVVTAPLLSAIGQREGETNQSKAVGGRSAINA